MNNPSFRTPDLAVVRLTNPVLLRLRSWVRVLSVVGTDSLTVFRPEYVELLRERRKFIEQLKVDDEILALLAKEQEGRVTKLHSTPAEQLQKMLELSDEELHHERCYPVLSDVFAAYRTEIVRLHANQVFPFDYWTSRSSESPSRMTGYVAEAQRRFGSRDLCVSHGDWNAISKMDDERMNRQWQLGLEVSRRWIAGEEREAEIASGSVGLHIATNGREATLWADPSIPTSIITTGPLRDAT